MDTIPCTYRISVKAAITDAAGRILLVRQSDGFWELPGGGLEHTENIPEALAREIAEETGLTVQHIHERPEIFYTIQKDVGVADLKWFAFVVYAVAVTGTFRPDPAGEEAQEAGYFTREEAGKLLLHANTEPYFK